YDAGDRRRSGAHGMHGYLLDHAFSADVDFGSCPDAGAQLPHRAHVHSVRRLVTMTDDRELMARALEEARAALEHNDVPIGCVVARGDEVLARAHNARERDQDPTAHAEV